MTRSFFSLSVAPVAFKEICPAGPGYHYSTSSLQFSQKLTEQLGTRGSLPVTQDNQGTYSSLCIYQITRTRTLIHLFVHSSIQLPDLGPLAAECPGLRRSQKERRLVEPLRLQASAPALDRLVPAVPKPDPVCLSLARPPALLPPGLCSLAVAVPALQARGTNPRLPLDPGLSRAGLSLLRL